jgi:glucan endo-1,3-alpha-glucosidase
MKQLCSLEAERDQCYCGNTLDSSRQTSSGCSVACPGDAKSTCGGSYRLNVYQLSGPPPATTSVAPSTTSQKPSTTVKPSTTAKPSTTSVKPSTTSVKPSSSAPAPAASVYGVKYPPSDSKTKYVWAHHMVGNVSHLDAQDHRTG